MEHVIDLFFRQEDEVRHIVLDETKTLVARQMSNVVGLAGDQVIDSDNAMPFGEEAIAQMRPEKPSAAGHDREWLRAVPGHCRLI